MTFSKVLVAEDADDSKKGVMHMLSEMGILRVDQSQFCDDALLKVKKAIYDKAPYELLISDLSFITDSRTHNITKGEELIAEVKNIQPNIKVIVFSAKDMQAVIKPLMEELEVDGYVCKGLNGLKELHKAVEWVAKGKVYTCPIATAVLSQKNVLELSEYEQRLLQLVAKGYKHREISAYFTSENIKPYSERSIEDRLSKLRDDFNASTTPQLIYMAQSLGLI